MRTHPRYYLLDGNGWIMAGGLTLAQAGHEIARITDKADGSDCPLPSDSAAEQLAIDWFDGCTANWDLYPPAWLPRIINCIDLNARLTECPPFACDEDPSL